MQVKRNTLLPIACLVWGAAGFSILRIGLQVYPDYISMLNILLLLLVFTVFQKFIFGGLVKSAYSQNQWVYTEERQFFLKFFNRKAFVIMVVIITGGIGLQETRFAPDGFIAVFYSGLGASLLLAGILFGRNYGKAVLAAATVENKPEYKGE